VRNVKYISEKFVKMLNNIVVIHFVPVKRIEILKRNITQLRLIEPHELEILNVQRIIYINSFFI